jgi:succinate dehydrogenase / fumarate reductase, membrane anchor subunit
MSLRTDLARVRGLGSARNGTGHWWAQRLTALALVPLMLWLVVSLVMLAGAEHATVVAWLGNPLVAVPMVLLIAAGFHHAQLGVQVVIEDYVHTECLKVASIILVKFAAAALGVAAAFSVLKIAFSG